MAGANYRTNAGFRRCGRRFERNRKVYFRKTPQKFARQSFGKLTSIEFFRELKSQNAFIRLNVSPDLVVETTNLPADQTAQLIVKTLNLA